MVRGKPRHGFDFDAPRGRHVEGDGEDAAGEGHGAHPGGEQDTVDDDDGRGTRHGGQKDRPKEPGGCRVANALKGGLRTFRKRFGTIDKELLARANGGRIISNPSATRPQRPAILIRLTSW